MSESSELEDLGSEYKILGVLGEGAHGVVYRAVDIILQCDVAIKVLKAEDDIALLRFRKEAAIVARLAHPNIVKVLKHGLCKGAPYIVYEYIEGKTLASRLQSGPIELSEFRSIFCGLLNGLSCAHDEGIIHRDLKPSNVLLLDVENVTPKIIDFGIAKDNCSNQDQKLTATDQMIGSAEYMSPEQCLKQPLDSRSDLYAVACMMYQCVTGNPPFVADTMMHVVFKKVREDPPSLRGSIYGRKLPAALRSLIDQNLARNPRDRSHDARSMLEELESLPDNYEQSRHGQRLSTKSKIVAVSSMVLLALGVFVYQRAHRGAGVTEIYRPTRNARSTKEEFNAIWNASREHNRNPPSLKARQKIISDLSRLIELQRSRANDPRERGLLLVMYLVRRNYSYLASDTNHPNDYDDAIELCRVNGQLSAEAFTPLYWKATSQNTPELLLECIKVGTTADARKSVVIPDAYAPILQRKSEGIGVLYYLLSARETNRSRAIKYAEEGVEQFGPSHSYHSILNTVRLAELYRKEGRRDKCLDRLDRAERIVTATMNESRPVEFSDAVKDARMIAEEYCQLKKFQTALDFFLTVYRYKPELPEGEEHEKQLCIQVLKDAYAGLGNHYSTDEVLKILADQGQAK